SSRHTPSNPGNAHRRLPDRPDKGQGLLHVPPAGGEVIDDQDRPVGKLAPLKGWQAIELLWVGRPGDEAILEELDEGCIKQPCRLLRQLLPPTVRATGMPTGDVADHPGPPTDQLSQESSYLLGSGGYLLGRSSRLPPLQGGKVRGLGVGAPGAQGEVG